MKLGFIHGSGWLYKRDFTGKIIMGQPGPFSSFLFNTQLRPLISHIWSLDSDAIIDFTDMYLL